MSRTKKLKTKNRFNLRRKKRQKKNSKYSETIKKTYCSRGEESVTLMDETATSKRHHLLRHQQKSLKAQLQAA